MAGFRFCTILASIRWTLAVHGRFELLAELVRGLRAGGRSGHAIAALDPTGNPPPMASPESASN
jgi:hypothetical protein